MLRRAFLPAIVLLLLASCAHRADFDAAEEASYNSEFSRAKKIYAEVAAKDPKQETRDKAAVRLANIQWRVDEHPDEARRTLAPVTRGGGSEQSAALIELSRLERNAKNWDAARSAAARARDAARDESQRRIAVSSYALSIIEPEKQRVLDGGTVRDRAALAEAKDVLRAVVDAEPGRLTRSLALMDAAALLGDTDTIGVAFRSYFATAPHLTMGSDVARSLVEARLFDEAVIVAPQMTEIARYARMVREASKRTNDYYRTIAQNDGDVPRSAHASWQSDLIALATSLWKDVVGTPFDPEQVDNKPDGELARRFGLFITLGETGDVQDAHGGHKVLDESRDVEQYGKRATTRFILLDTMISNGYETWARDGRGQHGGWGGVGLIVQVRPAYAEGALGPWRRLTDPVERKKADEDIARETKLDEERAKKNPYAYLHGLELRLERQSAERLLQRMPRREDWLAERSRMVQESSIFAHEGRHAIDKQYTKIDDSAELEFRAKLSEIAFAPDPRIALTGGIIDANIGSSTPHGKANLRVMKGLVAWMKEHGRGDPSRPLLPQLDTLTDDELRAAARSMDEWAK